MKRTLMGFAYFAAATAIACGPANNDNNDNNNNGTATNNGMSTNNGTTAPDCDNPEELDVSTVVDGGTLEAGSCYLVNQRLNVSGGTLVVEEGVVLQFDAGVATNISEDGRLTVQGTEEAPVFFTGQEETNGFWKGLNLASSGADNTMDWLVIEYAGSDGWSGASTSTASFYANTGSSGAVTNCEIRHGGGHGLQQVSGAAVSFSGCKISDNQYGGYVHPNNASLIAADNQFADNATNVMRVVFGNNDAVTEERTWNDIGVPWRVEDRFYVRAPLTLAPGIILEFNEDTSMILAEEGRIIAAGAEESPITFTGVEKIRGYWKGVQIPTRGQANQLDWVIFEYGGSDAWTGGADTESTLRMDGGSSVSISNTIFRESGNYAVWAHDDVVFDAFSGNTFENNAKVARMHPNIVGQISSDNTFTGNDDNMFRVTFGNNDAVSTEQTWSALEIPYLVTDRTSVGAALTIEEGTTVRFLEGASLLVKDEGSLTAVGTADAPIVFTSAEGEETAGFWKGLEFGTASTANVLDNVEVRYAGAGTWYGGENASGAIHVNNGTLSISNAIIADINGWGIDVNGTDGVLTACDNVTFENVTEPVKEDLTLCL